MKLAEEIGSLNFLRAGAGWLASVCVQQGDLRRAESVLDTALGVRQDDRTASHRTFGQRFCWHAWAELELARGRPARALQIIDELISSPPNVADPGPGDMPLGRRLRGEALAALGRFGEAELELVAAQRAAVLQAAPPLEWRCRTALGRLYKSTGRHADAETEYAAAHRITEELASAIPDTALRENFRQRSAALWA